jgi:hypothetical protein
MKTRTQFLPLAALASLAIATSSADAATTLTGVVPTVTNAPVPADHGSNEAGTPNIVLDWSTGGNWDQYANWDGRGDSYQLQSPQITTGAFSGRVVFTPDTGFAVTITSFDLDEWAGGGDTTVDWTISGSSSGTLASGTWDDFNTANDPGDAGGRSTVTPNVTGADGEVLMLSFAQSGGNGEYLALDNLTFDQVVPGPDTTPPTIVGIANAGGDTWEVKLEGNPATAYVFRESATLDFTSGTLVENLTPGDPAVGTIGGTNASEITTDGSSGNATVQMTLLGPANFVRAEESP